jgi:hypothetical protein
LTGQAIIASSIHAALEVSIQALEKAFHSSSKSKTSEQIATQAQQPIQVSFT